MARSDARSHATSAATRHLVDLASGRSGRVLVADDDLSVRTLFALVLGEAGFDVDTAEDGPGALAAARRASYDAVVLDLWMPGLDGLEVLAGLREAPATRAAAVLLVTGAGDLAHRIRGLDAGADDYLVKPVDPDELVARVRAQIRGRRTWRSAARERQRCQATVTDALCALPPGLSTAAAAQSAARELTALEEVDAAAVVVFRAAEALVLGASGTPGAPQLAGRPLPGPTARHLQLSARHGSWLEDESLSVLAPGWLFPPPLRPACAPLRRAGAVLGVLVLASADEEHSDGLLGRAAEFAPLVAALIGGDLLRETAEGEAQAMIRRLLADGAFRPVFQPIVRLDDRSIAGHELLTRFADGVPPQRRFAEAGAAGLRLELEAATALAGVQAAARLAPEGFLSVNVSPEFALSGGPLQASLASARWPLVLELTEHDPITDYPALRTALADLDVEICVDDAGAGYASLHHILALQPRLVKLDQSWVQGIEADSGRQALVAALRAFADRLGAQVIAEGVETQAQAATLRDLQVPLGQGWLFGRPRELVQV